MTYPRAHYPRKVRDTEDEGCFWIGVVAAAPHGRARPETPARLGAADRDDTRVGDRDCGRGRRRGAASERPAPSSKLAGEALRAEREHRVGATDAARNSLAQRARPARGRSPGRAALGRGPAWLTDRAAR